MFHRSSDVVVGGESVPKPSQRFQAIVVSLQQAVGNPLPLIWELKGAVFYCSSNNVLPAPSAPPPGAPWWLRSHSVPQPAGETQRRGRGLVLRWDRDMEDGRLVESKSTWGQTDAVCQWGVTAAEKIKRRCLAHIVHGFKLNKQRRHLCIRCSFSYEMLIMKWSSFLKVFQKWIMNRESAD